MIGEEKIRENAKEAVTRFASLSKLGAEFEYNRRSVAWVEEFIEHQRLRKDVTGNDVEGLVQLIGAYLGECVIHAYGGAWREHDGTWGVFFNASTAAFPFSKVRKQFDNGISGGDSILSFFDVIPQVLLRKN
jgi:hypothetical protein